MPPSYSKDGSSDVSPSWRQSNGLVEVTVTTHDPPGDTASAKPAMPPSAIPSNRSLDTRRRAMEFAKRHAHSTSSASVSKGHADGTKHHEKQQTRQQQQQPTFQAIRSPVTKMRPLKPPSELGAAIPEEPTGTKATPVVDQWPVPPPPPPTPIVSPSPKKQDAVAAKSTTREWATEPLTLVPAVRRSSPSPESPPTLPVPPQHYRSVTPPSDSVSIETPPLPLPSTSFAQSSADAVDWRRHGRQLRAQWVLEDEASGGSVFTINPDGSIERYYKVAERVLEQFLATSIRGGVTEATQLLEPYLIGNRLVKFLSMVLPTHPDYFEGPPALRLQSQEQLVQLLEYLEQLSQVIDELEYNKYILRDLTPIEVDLVKGLTSGGNGLATRNHHVERQLGQGGMAQSREHNLRSSSSVSSTVETPVSYVDVADGSTNQSTADSVLTQSIVGLNHHDDPLEQRVAEVVRVTEAFSEAYEKSNDAAIGNDRNPRKYLKQTLLVAARTLEHGHSSSKPAKLSSLHHKPTSIRAPSPAHSDPSIQQVSLPSVEPPSALPTNNSWEADDFSDFDFGPSEGSTVCGGAGESTPIHVVDESSKTYDLVKDPRTSIDTVPESSKSFRMHVKEEMSMTYPMEFIDETFEMYPMDFVEAPINTQKSPHFSNTTGRSSMPKLRDPPSAPSREIRALVASTMDLDDFYPPKGLEDAARDATNPRQPLSDAAIPVTTKIEERIERATQALQTLDVMDPPEVDAHFEAWRQEQERQQQPNQRQQQPKRQSKKQQQGRQIVPKTTPTAYAHNPSNPFNDDAGIPDAESPNRGVMRHFKGCAKCLLE